MENAHKQKMTSKCLISLNIVKKGKTRITISDIKLPIYFIYFSEIQKIEMQ